MNNDDIRMLRFIAWGMIAALVLYVIMINLEVRL